MEKIIFFMILGMVYSGKEESMSFKSPSLTDEEQHSSHLPMNMKCDACTAISYQMTQYIAQVESKFKERKLKESDLLDLFDNICSGSTWENYGLKSVNGVNRLSGKGLEADEVPGMMMGGGKWPGRLMSKCHEIVGDLGEEEIYSIYRVNKNLFAYLCKEYSTDCIAKTNKKKEL